ncbi:procollagen-lysine,2-oxoglutarate 5-dioxygenase isoform X2 [Daktulosphaira vitifoliae]|uniref:procollagen-lysine,2-oxoglutarate 5-dioxygenase isoform X2 n=1 Tax=Daktulosphaira vitifoliae TaxID=58002 RepID=UPI0021AA2A71|nr:procollagen-lysine,2-oxoglutarate 5-dioxygenase isoform X2 [Daktulosphaira vitifoliae]
MRLLTFFFVLSALLASNFVCGLTANDLNLLVLTVASEKTDGLKRFIRSSNLYNIKTKILGLDKPWLGGNMKSVGGGYKLNLFLEALKPYKDDNNLAILLTDAYDVVLLADSQTILNKFIDFNASIVIGAEKSCWPDIKLAEQYPSIESVDGYKFINSGGLIGYASQLYKLLSEKTIKDLDDDQLHLTKLYLNSEIRDKLKIKLDSHALLFQNLYAVEDDVKLRVINMSYVLENIRFNSHPAIVHGNGLSKNVLNSFTNYIPNMWSPEIGCNSCQDNNLDLSILNVKNYPVVLISIFVDRATPFFEEFLEKIEKIDYPKNKIFLSFSVFVSYHKKQVDDFISSVTDQYNGTFVFHKTSDEIIHSRHFSFSLCTSKSCDYIFYVESEAHLDNPQILKMLIQQNKKIIAPMLTRPFKAWSNFWGALSKEGYYARSFDYMDIINYNKTGVWNVPYISTCYLMNGKIVESMSARPSYKKDNMDYDMAFCKSLREKGVFMYVDNRYTYGHLIDSITFNISLKNPEMYQLFDNRYDWEQRYIHPDYMENFNPEKSPAEPCPDVFWFPIVSEQFCQEFIEIMENYGQWSDGTNNDIRLKTGYEAVPTRDIHMNQVGLENHWLEFLKSYVSPLQQNIFIGYNHDPPRSIMNFVVKYNPNGQASLRPHHDSSTYTINIALNKPGIDYHGGGCHFLRYKCKVTDMKVGWMLMHPGRLTHYHEGLEVINGTRYIMISFVDP